MTESSQPRPATADPVGDVTRLIRGPWVAFSIRAAVELGLVDALAEPAPLDRLAAGTSADPHALRRLLVVLEDLGLVRVDDHGTYALTASGQLLRRDDPGQLRSLALMQTELAMVSSWQRLADAIRSGRGVFDQVNGMSNWEYIAANPRVEADFNAAMARRAPVQAAAIRSGCDLAGVSTVVDVGGGKGAMLAELLRLEPAMAGVVADRAEVAAEANENFAGLGLAARASAVEADFFEQVPEGGDAYVVSNVIHDWDDDDAVAILQTVRAAMRPDSRLWLVEMVLDAPDRPPAADRDLHLVDLHMLVLFGARERTLHEYDALLQAAGFGAGRLLPTESTWNVIESRPASA